mgnify:CR=1 FL=1
MEIRIGIIINNLKDEWDNGNIKGFKMAYGKNKKELLKKIRKSIACIAWKKTNKKKNADILYFREDKNCLNFKKDRFKKMLKHFEDNIKYPT